MATNRINAQVPATRRTSHRFSWLFSKVVMRLLIAFIISWLILLAFFVSGVVSH